MKRTVLCCLLFLQFTASPAQLPFADNRANGSVRLPAVIFLDEVFGKRFDPSASPGITGSPFLKSWWTNCTITLNDNRVFENVPIRINLQNQMVHYLSRETEMLAPGALITEIRFADTSETGAVIIRTFRNGFPSFGNNTAAAYYEVLIDGAAKLLLLTKKKLVSTKTPGSPVEEKELVDIREYFVFKNNRLLELKKDRDFLAEFLSDKKDAVNSYIQSNKLKCKSISDLQKVILFYNSL